MIDYHLQKWKTDPFRKPLILRGARQVGKTYAVRKLGKNFKSFVEINFEKLDGAASLFEKDLSPDKLILALSLLTKTPIIPGETLLFLMKFKKLLGPFCLFVIYMKKCPLK
jgi:hypothetical protein